MIERAVLDKFNQKYIWHCNTIDDLKNHLTDYRTTDKILEFNNLVNTLKICDPAVGSGHFLVSCLNEIIYLKAYLGILADQSGKRIADYDFKLDNDEIIILNDTTGETYQYVIHQNNISKNIQHIQKTLFHEKQILIENCLFGVDINQNSVNICRLRLWIELLKNAYYTEISDYKELETLPNIDINIKCGNALLSRFPLNHALSDAFKNKGLTVTKYRDMVNTYKNTKDKQIKYDLESKIKEIKNHFRKEYTSKEKDKLKKKLNELAKHDTQLELLNDTNDKQAIVKRHKKISKEIQNEIDRLKKKIEDYENNQTFINALEWRFEFPEVLDDKGKFIGFDVVIGNPPYIKEYENKSAFNNLYNSTYYQGKMDIWYFFGAIGLDLLRPNGIQSYIAPNNWITNAGASKFRNKILQFSNIIDFIDFGNFMVFEHASIQTMIYQLIKIKAIKEHSFTCSYLKNNKATPLIIEDFLNKKQGLNNDNYNIFPVSINTDDALDNLITFIPPNINPVLNKILRQDSISFLKDNEIATGIDVHQDFVRKNHLKSLSNLKIGEGIFNLKDVEKQKIKPFYTTKELERYYTNTQLNNLWVLYLGSDTNKNIEKYPNIKKHLDKFTKIITSDNKPYGLHRARKEDFFIGEKIVSLRKCSNKPIFTYTDFDCYVSQSYCIIKTNRLNLKFLTALLNSKLIQFWLKHKGKLQGNNYQIDKVPLMQIPIKIKQNTEQRIIALVNERMNKPEHSNILEAQIDKAVYELYGLTDDEIKIIETALA